ncbi:GTPase [Lyngbya sp. CCY1209]|uniref:GTPase family protein n=1 Tax=Lyngbya sp. CCY1209 TaxID=2886103 RepID=UPI002D21329A|nr:GTPase [Lyngbya sp. CCY1209]MEB3886279.1 50S ribosome-binding GTPase [Lyngbya sp. CCY1209]
MPLPSWLTKIIRSPARWLEKDRLTVVFFGKTGVGKSSTLNALFGLNWDTDPAIACTKKPQFADFPVGSRKQVVTFALYLLIDDGLHRLALRLLQYDLDTFKYADFPYHQLRVVDLPGIGETSAADRKYMAYYKKWVAKADVLVWITQADTRAYKRDEIFLKKLKPFFKSSLSLILALNKIDCLEVYEGQKGFDIDKRQPSPDQLKLIPEKIDDIYGIFQNALDGAIVFEKSQIVPYTSFYSWGLESLRTKILARSSKIMKSFLNKFGIGSAKPPEIPLRLVVGLNQVDKITPDGWNEKLNKPEKEAKNEIERRCKDVIKKLTKEAEINDTNLEYYSALKRYRLINLLNKIIQNAYVGFKLGNINPKDPFELADPEAKKYADEQRKEMEKSSDQKVSSENQILKQLEEIISKDELNRLTSKLQQEAELPPKVAVIGQSGVGKTTTINNLFNADLKTSPTTVGTTQPQTKEFTLSTGGTLTVIDLPGYGRSEKEDQEYDKIYQDIIPSCDLILLVLQADAKDFADDIEMIQKIKKWLQDCPTPKRETN